MRTTCKTSAAIGAVALAIATAACGTQSLPKSRSAPTSVAASVSTPAVALPPGQAKFVAAIRSALAAHGTSNAASDTALAAIGTDIRTLGKDGISQASLIATTAKAGAEDRFSMSAGTFVRTAERDMCPAYLPVPPHVLISMSGNGQGSSAPFPVSTSTVTAKYTYDCAADGGSGNFIADMETGDQSSLNSDDQSIANALGAGGTATTTLYPTNVGQDYHLTVISECSWTVTLTSGG